MEILDGTFALLQRRAGERIAELRRMLQSLRDEV
jgi:hypothetical protein